MTRALVLWMMAALLMLAIAIVGARRAGRA